MRVQAEISLYPLRTEELSKPIDEFCQALLHRGLEVESGPMSTRIRGEFENVFEALEHAFTEVAQNYQVVLTVKLSNACPNDRTHGKRKASLLG